MTHNVALERGRPEQKPALANMAQLYEHDFADFMRPGAELYLQEDGRFRPLPYLDDYYDAPDREVWFIRDNGRLAGFVLLNEHAHSGRPVDHNMAEFFVARPHRRAGVASAAVAQILALRPGQWEVAISIRNEPAQRFWPRAIAAAGFPDFETLQGDGVEWTGPILRFRAG
jgi:predicted acetyltransferase